MSVASAQIRDTRRLRHLLTTFGAAAAWLTFVIAHASYSLRTGDAVGAPFFIQITVITYLFIRRNEASRISTSPRDWLVGFVGGFGSWLVRPEGMHLEGAMYAALPLQIGGLLLSIIALVELGRSFGIVAADRGIVASGVYGIVRHPAYLAYTVGEIGYLMHSLSWWNVSVILISWICQLDRIRAEEALLSENPEYLAYKEKVRYALVPGIW